MDVAQARAGFYFAAFKKHIGVYPPVTDRVDLIAETARFRGPKGYLSFPLNQESPLELIGRARLHWRASSDADPLMTTDTPLAPLDNGDFDILDTILDDLRTRGEDVPQWEFCEGAMAALLCTRRLIMPSEYLPVLLGVADDAVGASGGAKSEEGEPGEEGDTRFADAAQFNTFMALWTRRWNEVAAALGADVQALDDERAYHPEVMDVRGAVWGLPEAERSELEGQALPAFAQVWALGFMFVVENWAEEWAAPRDKEAGDMLNDALDAVVELTDDDTGEPRVNMHDEDGPPSVSDERLNAFGAALWAVYDLRQLWQSLGPKVEPLRRAAEPGRNDPCPCGSGKKYKKCHGA